MLMTEDNFKKLKRAIYYKYGADEFVNVKELIDFIKNKQSEGENNVKN